MKNPHYDDVYSTGGTPEKAFVFVHGNRLPERFAAMGNEEQFTVAELGFGLGLAFQATVDAFTSHASTTAHLLFISYELHPVTADALQCPMLQTHWRNLQPGWNTISLPGIRTTLHLYIGDAFIGLPTQPLSPVEAWFLDGHDPRRNPALWAPSLLTLVGQHTAPGGTASTYSAAGAVRRALQVAGFTVSKVSGFPPKRHMTVAVKNAPQP